jgi:two-component system sensor histidine kinase YcbA
MFKTLKSKVTLQKMIAIATIDTLTTQLYFNLVIGGFRVSLAVILLPVFLYFNPAIHPVIQSLFVMGFGFLGRGLLGLAAGASWSAIFTLESPIVLFDLSYGLIYYFFYSKSKNKTLSLWFGVILFNDFISNSIELLSRLYLGGAEGIQALPVLFLIASIRSVIAILLVLIYKFYLQILKKEEHNSRYQHLLTLASQLSSETYLMKKNMSQIENVMNEAYSLYENHVDADNQTAKQALNIAKDVHEIKKSYLQVMMGLEKLFGPQELNDSMGLKDLFHVIEQAFLMEKQDNTTPNVSLHFKTSYNMAIPHHFLMMSVIRNLVTNSLESLQGHDDGRVEVEAFYRVEVKKLVLYVRDNGHGIKARDLPCVFEPGFSTKYSPKTGDVQRGIGLTLVNDIIKETFHGTIDVKSVEGKGTLFTVTVPME